MHSKQRFQNSLLRPSSRAATLALAIVVVVVLVFIFTQPAQAQTFNVIHNFTGGWDGITSRGYADTGWAGESLRHGARRRLGRRRHGIQAVS